MTVQYLLNCRMITLPHFPTLCFSVELLTLISFALQVLLLGVEIELFYCTPQS